MIEQVISKLNAEQLDGKKLFALVEEGVDLQSVMKTALSQSPIAYVIEVSRSPKPNQRDIGAKPLQEVITEVGVIIGISRVNDRTGSKAQAQAQKVIEQVRVALFGFEPTTEHAPFELGRADTIGFTDKTLWKLERFNTQHFEQAV